MPKQRDSDNDNDNECECEYEYEYEYEKIRRYEQKNAETYSLPAYQPNAYSLN